MKILVAIKRVVDHNIKIRVKADGSDVDLMHVKMSMNPFDEIALEEAIRQKEAGIAKEIIAISIGPANAQDILRTALAMGADRAMLIKTEEIFEPLNIAKILQKITLSEKVDMVFLGKQAIDDDSNQTGQMLAALLNWGQATFASNITIEGNNARVAREIDDGIQTLSLPLPLVMTADLRLNEPRYVTLPNIMKAKKKNIEEIAIEDLGLNLKNRLKILKIEEPKNEKNTIVFDDSTQLIKKLQETNII